MSLTDARKYLASREGSKQESYILFAQEKYSNGETSLHYFKEYLQPDALYLLDEPEVSLSPANQVLLAEEINKLARLLKCQFIIATHSPFMLGTLHAKYIISIRKIMKWPNGAIWIMCAIFMISSRSMKMNSHSFSAMQYILPLINIQK